LRAVTRGVGNRGVSGRGVVSPLLSDILLTPFDREMRLRGYQLTRYADDWVITCKWAAETRSAVNAAHRILKQLGVELHPQKTRIAHVQHGFEFLGYKIKRGEKNFLCPRATGMRVSELLALQWADIDFERRLIHIRRTFYRGSFGLPKTSTSERVIPMSDGLHFALRQHKRNVRKSALALVIPKRRWQALVKRPIFSSECFTPHWRNAGFRGQAGGYFAAP
jgi:integrase